MRHKLMALCTLALLAMTISPTGATAGSPSATGATTMTARAATARPPARRLAPPAGARLDPWLLAHARTAQAPTMVILEMSGAPVAVQRAGGGRVLSRTQAAAARATLAAAQAPLLPRIVRLGDRVVGSMRDAYDGIQVLAGQGTIQALAALPGVVAVHHVATYERENVNAVPYVEGPGAWAGGATGTGRTIGLIDTGIDYYHADFGGSGDPADFTYGEAHDTATPARDHNGTTVAFPNAKVVGGYDFAGDAYDANVPADATPAPDGNPLDCGPAAGGDGHGTHTAGSAAGQGVLTNGTPFTGPYDATTYSGRSFVVGPGVAPQAAIREYRVFGCTGSTALVTLAIDRAVADGVDVISLSLSSDYGTESATDPSVAAADNAAAAGVVVVAAAGNDGPDAYVTGSPASAVRAISVAAIDGSTGSSPTYQHRATFSSGGPRSGDSGFKPDVAAPGVDVVSAGVGTGTGGAGFSGTSMATPMVAGAATLVLQGHPAWTDATTRVDRVKAALMDSADDTTDSHGALDLDPFGLGAGVMDAQAAATASVLATTADHSEALGFGYQPTGSAWAADKPFTVTNQGATSEMYDISSTVLSGGGLGVVATVDGGATSITVPAGGTATMDVRLSLSAAALAALPSVDTGGSGAMPRFGGRVNLTPRTPSGSVGTIHVPFTLVPR
ncbi:MAG: S8 family peptidase, partial [Candidatus Limnocylindrales bacterium]